MAKRSTSTENPETLLNELRALVAEAEGLTKGDINEQVHDKLAELKDRFHDAQERLSEYYDIAKEKVVEGARRTDQTIRSHPYESLAIALGVGVLIGALIRRTR